MDKPILLGGQIFRRDYNSFNYIGGERNTTYSQLSTGGAIRTGFPITEFMTLGGRYSLIQDKVSLDKSTFFTDPDGAGPLDQECDPLKAGKYLCDEVGSRLTSSVGYSAVYNTTDGIRPTRGMRIVLSQDFAGLGGDVKYLRSTADATKYMRLFGDWIFSIHGEGGYIQPGRASPGPGRDPIRLTDRFFGPQLRGFDIRGIGPRIQRVPYTCEATPCTGPVLDPDQARITDALGGRAYYMGRLELEFPISASLRGLGLRPSAFVDVGSLFKLTKPQLTDSPGICLGPDDGNTTTPLPIQRLEPGQGCNAGFSYQEGTGFREVYLGDSAKPRLSVGVGVNWTSPFGPLRLDIARAILKQEGDDTKLFSFNVGTSF
jgi:outer membrane protein insertion porin family